MSSSLELASFITASWVGTVMTGVVSVAAVVAVIGPANRRVRLFTISFLSSNCGL